MQSKQKGKHPSIESLTNYDSERKVISLPLEFQFLPIEILSKQFTKLNNNNHYRIHYLGPRPHNTLALHKKYSYCQKNHQEQTAVTENQTEKYRVDMRRIVQSHLVQEKLRGNNFYRCGLFYRAFEGMNPYLGTQQWIFNSLFESGNLDCVIKIHQCQFDLFLRVDSNTKGHVQWFYFSVKNGKKRETLKMNLCNLSKGKTLYDSGLQPYVFSKRKSQIDGSTWSQSGVNLGISKKELRYQYLEDKLPSHLMSFYCLELSYDFQYQDDEVFFAYCIPFTFSNLLKELSILPPQWVKQGVLGKSLSGIEIPLLHIANHQSQRQKKNILITGRWHPGESNSSHTLQGFINFLTGTSREAAALRNRLNFFIVPMANPDGVVCGNSRTSLAGKDLNRQFILASKDLYPEVALVKQLARKIQQSYGLFMYLDFHGHSRKKNTFFYGPAYSIHEPNYYKSRIFPKLVENVDSNFRFYSCSFTIDEEKKQAARAVIFQHLKVAFTFTIQTSIGCFYDCEAMKTIQFNQHQWRTIGTSIAQGLSKFIVGFEEYQELMKERRLSRQRRRPPPGGKHSFTQQFIEDQDEISSYFKIGKPLKIVYKQKSLFGSVIDELKSTKVTNFIKEIDEQCESDAHDETEEFQASKMKEFNSLLTDAAKRTNFNEKNHKNFSVKSHREAQLQKEIEQEDLAQELKFLEELQESSKTVPLQIPHQSSVRSSSLPKTAGQSKRRFLGNRTTALSQMHSKPPQQKIEKVLNRKSFDKKIVSQSELISEKISYFGEFRIFVDKQKVEEKANKTFHRNSVFNRDRSKSSNKRSFQEGTTLSQNFFEKACRTAFVNSSAWYNPPKANNFQFKFDQIETAAVAKEKLKDYLRGKINNKNRNTIGPASFYGLRQNINQKKLSNKQKFFGKEESPKKESLKVIKFT